MGRNYQQVGNNKINKEDGMRKFLVMLGLMVGFVSISQARMITEDTKWRTILSSASVVSTAIVASSAIYVGDGENFSLMVEEVSGTADVKVEYQVVNSNTNSFLLVVDTTTNSFQTMWITPATNYEIFANVTDDTVDVFEPIPTKYIRIVVTGNAGNGADAIISVYMSIYSER